GELDAELAARQRCCLPERADRAGRVAGSIDRIDRRASTTQQFDQSHVLVVTTVGDVQELAAEVVLADELAQQVGRPRERLVGAWLAVRSAQPAPKARGVRPPPPTGGT